MTSPHASSRKGLTPSSASRSANQKIRIKRSIKIALFVQALFNNWSQKLSTTKINRCRLSLRLVSTSCSNPSSCVRTISRLLSSSNNIELAGDGTKFKTGARPVGPKLCDCPKQGIYRCDCSRIYTDRFASWGWDNYRECFVYGHAFYELTAASSPYDLPIYLHLAQAKEHDSVNGVKAFDRAHKLFPELDFTSFLGESAHDNFPTYNLMRAYCVTPIIALNERHKGHYQLDGNFTTDSSATPVCPKGEIMVAGGFCPDRCRMKWRCPLVAHNLDKPC